MNRRNFLKILTGLPIIGALPFIPELPEVEEAVIIDEPPALVFSSSDTIYVGGDFANGYNRRAMWNGTAWQGLNPEIASYNPLDT